MIPDKQVPWIMPAVREGTRLHSRNPFDLVFGSSGPRSNLVAAGMLAQRLDLPCVMEYRDLWTDSPYLHIDQPTSLHRYMHRWLEARTLRRATRLTCVSHGIAKRLDAQHARNLAVSIDVNFNFFVSDEYPAKEELKPSSARSFNMIHAGNIYHGRNPSIFFRGLGRFLRQKELNPSQFRLTWIGNITDMNTMWDCIKEEGLVHFVEFRGSVGHRESLASLKRSNAAVIIQAPNDSIHIPGKLFEAMGAGVPVLAIANPCEVTEIIDSTNCGVHCQHDEGLVCGALERLWQCWQQSVNWPFRQEEIGRFEATRAVSGVSRLFDEVITS